MQANRCKRSASHRHGSSEIPSRVGVARCVHSDAESRVTTSTAKASGPYWAARGIQLDHEDVKDANRCKRGASHRHVSLEIPSRVGVTRCVHGDAESLVNTSTAKASGPYWAARGIQLDHEDVKDANRCKRGASHRHVSLEIPSRVGVTRCVHGDAASVVTTGAAESNGWVTLSSRCCWCIGGPGRWKASGTQRWTTCRRKGHLVHRVVQGIYQDAYRAAVTVCGGRRSPLQLEIKRR